MIDDSVLRSYEKYIFTDKNVNDALVTMPNNQEDYLFLKVLHTLNNSGLTQIRGDKDIKEAFY